MEIENTDLATINGKLATGHVLGKTTVILRDKNVPNERDNGDADQPKPPTPSAMLTITEANKIALNLLPHYNWATVDGERHEIAIDLYTHDDNKIILGSKYKIQSQLNESIFYPISRNRNGSRINGETVKSGTSIVEATFNNLQAQEELLVYAQIQLVPEIVILPYDPNNPKRQQIQFTATGGDGTFAWSSLTPNHVSITQTGLASTTLETVAHNIDIDEKIGLFGQIKVAMLRNLKIAKTADLLFLPPVKLEIVKYNFETALNDYVEVHVALYAKHNNKLVSFTSCDNLNFELDFSNEIFHNDVNGKGATKTFAKNACHLILLKATNLGSTQLKVTYNFGDIVLRDEVPLIVFEKLNILNPISNEIVLPIGSSRNVIYYNGPQKIFNIEAELYRRTDFDQQLVNIVGVDQASVKDKHIFNVLCKKVGETTLTFEIYNILSTHNYLPYLSKYVTTIHCVKPRFINLYTTEKLRQSCPLKLKNSLMHVKRNDNNLVVDIEVLDAQNRKLMNISSLIVDWQFSEADGKNQANILQTRQVEEEIVAGVPVPLRDFLLTSIPDIQNNYKIKATVVSYDRKVLKQFSIIPENPEFGIQKVNLKEIFFIQIVFC